MSKSHLKVRTGLLVKGITSYPTDPEEGDLVYRSDLNKYGIYRDGAWASLIDDKYVQLMTSTNSTLTGALQTIPTPTTPFIRLTNGTLESISGITPAAVPDGNVIMISNATGTTVTFYDEELTEAVANRLKTGNAKPIKLKNDGTLIFIYDATSQRWRASGGTGGAGTGDAFAIEETLKDRFLQSPFDLMTPYTVLKSEDALLSTTGANTTSTATYSIIDDSINFTGGSQELITTNLLDTVEFLPSGLPLTAAELLVFWKPTDIDTAATYELSRDGGNEFQVVTMERVGSTELWRGYHTFTDEAANQTLQEKAIADSDSTVDLDDGTAREKISQIFTVTNTELIKEIELEVTSVGTPLGNYKVSIVKDDTGSPGDPSDDVNDNLSETALLPVSGITTGTNNLTVDIPDVILVPGDYHIVFTTDATYRASYSDGVDEISLRHDSATTPVSNVNDGATWTGSAAGQMVYEVNGLEFDLRAKVTDSGGGAVKLDGLGVLYDLSSGVSFDSLHNIEQFQFAGALDTTEFTLTKFVPHPDLLKVYDIGTGQVYVHGAWVLDGQKVTFEAGQFLNPGEVINLKFIQNEAATFDNSDVNALLMASNNLGSTDGSIDKSVAGHGIFIRRPDGTLREIAIDDDDNIVIYSV